MKITLTPERLMDATGCTEHVARIFAEPLTDAMDYWGVDAPHRAAMFIAQWAYESDKFTSLEENLYYSTPARLIAVWPSRFRFARRDELDVERFADGKRNPAFYVRNPQKLAEFTYGGRNGNGKEGSGDGWRFRGRGIPMLTFRDNYAWYAEKSGFDVIDNPLALTDVRIACDAAGCFWVEGVRGNEYADRGDYRGLTVAINGGLTGYEDGNSIGLDDRVELWHQCSKVLR